MHIYNDECEAAGLDRKEVRRIAAGLSRYGKQARELGLTVFGCGTGDIRTNDGCLIVASIDGDFDGGDGTTRTDAYGLLRGEHYYEGSSHD